MSDVTPTPEDVEAAQQLIYAKDERGLIDHLTWPTGADQLVPIIAQFRAEARQAGAADTARLDWIQSAMPHGCNTLIMMCEDGKTLSFLTWGGPAHSAEKDEFVGRTLREAIDAARNRAEQMGGGEGCKRKT